MKLSQRILILILAIIMLTTLANFLLAQYNEERLHADSERILVDTISQSLSDALIQDVIDNNQLQVTYVLKKLHNHKNPIEFIYITNGGPNKVFAHSFTNGFPRYLLEPQKQNNDMTTDVKLTKKVETSRGVIYIYVTTLLSGLDVTLHVGINQTEIKTKLAQNRAYFLLASAIIAILAIFFAYYWSKQITQPLANFTKQIELFGSGESVNLKRVNKNIPEIRCLAHAFEAATEAREQALMTLREREKNLEVTLNSIGDAVIATDALGNITRMNPVAINLTGWSLEDAIDKSIETIFPIVDASTRKEIINPIDKVISTGETVYLSNHTTLISKDGTEYQIADSAAPIRDENNKILGMVLVFNDVTQLYQLRQEIAEKEKRYQTLAKMSPVGIFYTNSEGECLYVNEKWCEIAGLSSEQALGSGWVSTLHEEDKELVFTQWSEAKKLNKPFRLEYRFIQADEVCWVLGEAIAETSEDGQIVGYVGTITDITDRKEAEAEQSRLQQKFHHSQKMDALGKLTGGIAHDYNNMLGVILGYSELLQNMLNNDSELSSFVKEIQHAGKRGAELTTKLLSFSRPNKSNAKLLDINASLLEAQNMLERTLTARIKLTFDFEKDLWPVWLSNSDLEDAIMNLSINALHAINGNGKLFIQTSNIHLNEIDAQLVQLRVGDYVLISFTDTGCGMDESIKNKIFEPFFSTKGDKGTGLGLSQIYGFVNSNNGAIKVYSEPGRGSRFMLYFPRYQDESVDHEILSTESTKDTGGKENILVVDDEPALLKLTCKILNNQGYVTYRAESAEQALLILQQETIDLLLTDVIMPEVSGYELAAIVAEKYPHIKIQMASGFNDDSHTYLVNEELSQNLLCKPYNSQNLFEHIRVLLDD